MVKLLQEQQTILKDVLVNQQVILKWQEDFTTKLSILEDMKQLQSHMVDMNSDSKRKVTVSRKLSIR